jgi:hypothetical protein
MSTRNLPGSKGRPARRADNLTAICESTVYTKCGEPRRLTTLWASTACYRDSFTFLLLYKKNILIVSTALSSGMKLPEVRYKSTYVSEGHTDSIFMVKEFILLCRALLTACFFPLFPRLNLRATGWRQHIPPKRRQTYTRLHGVIS